MVSHQPRMSKQLWGFHRITELTRFEKNSEITESNLTPSD